VTRGSPALAACVAVALAAAGPAHAGDKRELRRRAITIDDAALTSVPEIRNRPAMNVLTRYRRP
jgi:hypothetical protein